VSLIVAVLAGIKVCLDGVGAAIASGAIVFVVETTRVACTD
jgi:hypothetical protein